MFVLKHYLSFFKVYLTFFFQEWCSFSDEPPFWEFFENDNQKFSRFVSKSKCFLRIFEFSSWKLRNFDFHLFDNFSGQGKCKILKTHIMCFEKISLYLLDFLRVPPVWQFFCSRQMQNSQNAYYAFWENQIISVSFFES